MRSCKRSATGDKQMVGKGLAERTPGGLTKGDLMYYKGRYVSKKQHEQGMKLHRKYPIPKCVGEEKPNCDASKGPLTYICGDESKGGHITPVRKHPARKAKRAAMDSMVRPVKRRRA